MRAWLVLCALTLLLSATPHPAAAEAGLPQGCFCLRHVATDQVLRGCSGFKLSQSDFGHAGCTDEKGEKAIIMMTDAWDIVVDGDSGCDPCRTGERRTRDVPRQPRQEDGDVSEDSR